MRRLGRRLTSACLPLMAFEAAEAVELAQEARSFLERYCIECHGAEKSKAGVRFDTRQGFEAEERDVWTLAHEMVTEGAMPPEDAPQPSVEERRRFTNWVEVEEGAARAIPLRRLNRRELAAALRDLTGLSVDYVGALPEDGTVAGFDTGVAGLQDAADSVARIMWVTRRAVDALRFSEPDTAQVFEADLRDVRDPRKALDHWKAGGAYVKPRGHGRPEGILMNPKWLGDRGEFSFNLIPPEDGGVLRLSFDVAIELGNYGDALPFPHLWVAVGGEVIERREIRNPPNAPITLTYEIQIDDLPVDTRGLEVALHPKVEVPYAVEGFDNEDKSRADRDPVPGGTGLYRPVWDRKAKLPPEEIPAPHVVIQRIEARLGHQVAWPPASWQIEPLDWDASNAPDVALRAWMDRAWRRPTTAAERAPFLQLYADARERGATLDAGLRGAFHAVLMSPEFRFLASPSLETDLSRDFALASRLSFFLTGAPPDAILWERASTGRLTTPVAWREELERLVASAAFEGFVHPFVTQWLEMDQPITVAMDHIQKQDFRFGRLLKDSLKAETLGYVKRLFVENRPLRALLSSDWTLMNQSLARHYGYPPLRGAALRPVTLRPDDPRGGGVLGHAGIQSMLTWMGENWVIYRGAWLLRTLMDDPPPPPPLEVPELIPSDHTNEGMTYRELLRQHQEDPNCSVCHEAIDPLGFAFQNFDLSGRWRDVEYGRYEREELDGKVAWWGQGDARPVDASGHLPRGERFATFSGFRAALATGYQKDVVRGLLRRLVLFGTGRFPDVAGRREIESVLDRLAEEGYPMRQLLLAVTESSIFQGDTSPEALID